MLYITSVKSVIGIITHRSHISQISAQSLSSLLERLVPQNTVKNLIKDFINTGQGWEAIVYEIIS